MEPGDCGNRAGARDAEAAMVPSATPIGREFSSRRLSRIGPCRRMRHVCDDVRFSAIPTISARDRTDHLTLSITPTEIGSKTEKGSLLETRKYFYHLYL